MQRYGISQLPVVRDEPVDSLADVVGSLQERELLERVFRNADALNEDVAVAMQPPLPAVDADASVDQVYEGLSGGSGAVVVVSKRPASGILTRSDLLEFLAARRSQVESSRELRANRDVHGADDDERARERQRARALAEERPCPSAIATSGFTYWCVTTSEIGATRSSQAYAVNPTSEPMTTRYTQASTESSANVLRAELAPLSEARAPEQEDDAADPHLVHRGHEGIPWQREPLRDERAASTTRPTR